MSARWPPFRLAPFGSTFMVRCSICGDVEQVADRRQGRWAGQQHQRWTHPTDEEREADALRDFEEYHMDGFCERCGHEGHEGAGCPIVTPDLLRRATSP